MKRLVTLSCAVLVLSLPSASSSRTWHVPSEAPTIQAGVDSAAASDTVLVAAGTYTGSSSYPVVDFNGKNLVLVSEDGPAVTIIDGEAGRACLRFDEGEGPATVVEGFTIKRGFRNSDTGGGVDCQNGSSPSFNNCIFTENSADWGGGAMSCREGSSPAITACSFVGNSCSSGSAAALACFSGSSPSLLDCSFTDNSAAAAGAVTMSSSSPTFDNCTFTGNEATAVDGSGGAMVISSSSPTLTNCTFTGNVAGLNAGAIKWSSDCAATIEGCIFLQNSAGSAQGGGGMAGIGGNVAPTITNCTFSENSAGSAGGGGAFYCHNSSPSLENTIVAFSAVGQAFYCEGSSSPTLTCCDVYGNAGGDWVACIAGQGGANGNISTDPLFCGAYYPGDPYRLDSASPCTERHSSCGVIGARHAGCTGMVGIAPTTWGRVKAIYRGTR